MDSRASETTFVLAAEAVTGSQTAETILKLFEDFDVVNIDVSGVRYLDLSDLDLLIYAKKLSKLRSKKLYLKGRNKVVDEIINAFQLADYFGDSMLSDMLTPSD